MRSLALVVLAVGLTFSYTGSVAPTILAHSAFNARLNITLAAVG